LWIGKSTPEMRAIENLPPTLTQNLPQHQGGFYRFEYPFRSGLALALLVLGVLANNPQHPAPPNESALGTNLSH